VPFLVGLAHGERALATDRLGSLAGPAILDADTGSLTIAADAAMQAEASERLAAMRRDGAVAAEAAVEAALTASGEPVAVTINVDDPAILDELDPAICDGIGLVRTEFLVRGGVLPGEDAQFAVYQRIMRWAAGRPVTFRTIDAGGDKPVRGFTIDGEANPFLGVRGLRLSLLKPEIFAVQLRALVRAASSGNLKIMLPMVTVPAELEAARALLREAISDVASRGLAHGDPSLGIMVETPASAILAERFDAAFYSIGSNDLIQYVTACARDNAMLADLARPDNEAVLELIGRTVEAAARRGAEVSLCGDMASDVDSVPVLLRLGLRSLSVAPALVGRVKQAIRAFA
jgi:phosphotransferase system enzyme I (PtsI)